MIKTIIFDIGDVLASNIANSKCFERAAKVFGVKVAELNTIADKYIPLIQTSRITEKVFWKNISHDCNTSLPNNWQSLLRNDFNKYFELYPEMNNYLMKLKQNGYTLVVLSNTVDTHYEILIKKMPMKIFDYTFFSNKLGIRKPEKEIYMNVLEKIGMTPNECLFIDDSEENIKSAKKVGIQTIKAINSKQIINDTDKALKSTK